MAKYGTNGRRRRAGRAVVSAAVLLGVLGVSNVRADTPEGAGQEEAPLAGPTFGWDIARGIAAANRHGGYILDGWGAVHAYGSENHVPAAATISQWWEGWDIARELALVWTGEDVSGGYVLDGWGGIHPFSTGDADAPPAAEGSAPWVGNDIARDIEVVTTGGVVSGGYVLDAFGGVHAFAVEGGTAPPAATVTGYWDGWDIARDLVIISDGDTVLGGYVLDGWGGIHPFAVEGGSVPPAPIDHPYWSGWDIAESLEALGNTTEGEVRGLVVQDGFGGIYELEVEGGPQKVPAAEDGCTYYGDDVARDLAVFANAAHALRMNGQVAGCDLVAIPGQPEA